jgi:hypothetical protein
MPAAKRVSSWVLVLSPDTDGSVKEAVSLGRQACREIHQRKLTPIFPLLSCLTYLTEEEMKKDYPRECTKWLRRVSSIWLCLARGQVDIDPVTHDILVFNEGLMSSAVTYQRAWTAPSRLPVYRFWVLDTGTPMLIRLAREELHAVLRCNIMDGLFRGVAAC